MWRSAAARSASRVDAMPSSRSEWPEMNFVALWMTTSAPSSSGRWSSGVAKVASTATAAPAAWAPAIRRVELGDADERVGRASRPTAAPRPRTARRTASVSVMSASTSSTRPAARALAQQHPHAGVADRRADHARAHRQRLEHGARRRHAGRERDRLAALQLRRSPSPAPPRSACPPRGRSRGCGSWRRARRGARAGPRTGAAGVDGDRVGASSPRSPARRAARSPPSHPGSPRAAGSGQPAAGGPVQQLGRRAERRAAPTC